MASPVGPNNQAAAQAAAAAAAAQAAADAAEAQAAPEAEAAEAAEAAAHARLTAEASAKAESGLGIDGHQYGYTPEASASRGVVTNSELMLWLAERSADMNAELRDLLDGSELRSKVVQDLTHLKSKLCEGMSVDIAKSTAEAMINAYAGTPYEAEITATLGPLVAAAEASESAQMTAQGASSWQTELQGRIDFYGKNDQLAMVEIQDLTNKIREATQLASNLIASSNQAALAIVGNIGR